MLSHDGRASYSDMSKQIGVSVSTVRNRVTNMRDSGVLHLNVWLDPYLVGLGINVTFLIRVEAGAVDEVAKELVTLDSTGYIAAVAGDHDLMVDAFCQDVPHLNKVLHDEIQAIEGVLSVTTYLVTDIKYESSLNIAGLLDAKSDNEQPANRRPRAR